MGRKKNLLPSIDSENILYFTGLICFMLLSLQYETYWTFHGKIVMLLQWGSLLFLSMHLLFAISKYRRMGEISTLIFCLFVSIIVGTNSHQWYQIVVGFLLVFGSKDIGFRNIIKVYVLVGGTFWFITVLGSQLGYVKNVQDDVNSIRDIIFESTTRRWCLGYRWSTNMANHIFFVLLAYFYSVDGKLEHKDLAVTAAILFVVVYFADCRLSGICIFLILISSVVCKVLYCKKIILGRTLKKFFILSVPIFLIISIVTIALYDSNNIEWYTINMFFSNRLTITKEMLTQYGIPWLGQYFKVYSSARDDGELYNYIDSSYWQMLLIYGVIYTSLVLLGYIILSIHATKKADYALLFAILIAGISGIIAQHFMEFYMNPLLLGIFAKKGSSTININSSVLYHGDIIEKKSY